MNDLAEMPPFEDFYRSVHGRPPFPWQSRLARTVDTTGWPGEIGVPTGLGKTSCIDIAVWSLAAQAHLNPSERTIPTRVWYVVDRRLLVDAASDHADQLARRLAESLVQDDGDETLAVIARRLASIGSIGSSSPIPLFVSRLRGGVHPGGRPPHPAQPSIVCSTVAMYGSRLLFRGYGMSNRMWPIDAALAGTDSLVLLDEAHLAVPLQELLGILPSCDANRTGVLRAPGRAEQSDGPADLLPAARSYPRLVALTATGRGHDRFDLDDHDWAHPVVRKRLDAAKPTTLVETTEKALAHDLATHAVERVLASDEPVAAVVFVNRPRTAREVKIAIDKQVRAAGRSCTVEVLTGQLRDPDADGVRQRLLDPVAGAPAGAPGSDRSIPLLVIATQTLEVGADLDFDICVSETAGVRALTQRWGRLNRLGEKPHASGVLCHPTDRKDGGLYGAEPADIWQRLSGGATTILELGPALIAEILGVPQDQPDFLPELLPVHLWEAAKTSCPPLGAAPPEVFFAGVEAPEVRLMVAWRSVLPPAGQPVLPRLTDREFVDVPVWELQAFLDARGVGAHRVADDGLALQAVDAEDLRPGYRVVLPVTLGGYERGWTPDQGIGNADVLDLAPLVRGSIIVDPAAISNLCGRDIDADERELLSVYVGADPDDVDLPATVEALALVLDSARDNQAIPASLRGALDIVGLRIEAVWEGAAWLATWDLPTDRRAGVAIDALDELSSTISATLYDHLVSVGEVAGRIASDLGLPGSITGAIREAGRFHDLGKADRRFQRWLGAPDDSVMAKSKMSVAHWQRAGVASGWPRGARHELLSIQMLEAALSDGMELEEPDLVRHLVLSHHGHGRPLCPIVEVASALPTTFDLAGQAFSASTDPGRADWNQPDRFRALCERYGFWGAALLEAVLRQADHLVSAVTEVI